ncbi:hypothetical protein QTN47_19400 [Danxiaibacter flavus]|uniref:Uncharacterized protein n=1 Tax=Danxiaibacter flavus TaxID=3049108 RepID=A0ABV3ZJI0_9BACT|nr:hypothetical protein QNM32_19410 [Chitinophagaceae bacterium DXS]
MDNALHELETLFEEAKGRSDFDFVLTLINYRGLGTYKLTTNLHEWFEAIGFYKKLYFAHSGREKTRIGALLYSTFFENSDFYNIIGSLCRIKLGFKGSSYLFWKTKKYERLLGIGEKQDFLIELLNDAKKDNIIDFFKENHFKEIRNTFFHSAYSLSDEEYIFHDSDPIVINGVGHYGFNVKEFLYPKVENVISFFDEFQKLYLGSFDLYKENMEVTGLFPNPTRITILGSANGLQGFKIKNAVQFFGEWKDSGIWYNERSDMWEGWNLRMGFDDIQTIEIREQLTRYENKEDIHRSDTEFQNLVDKIIERKETTEIGRATHLLIKFGNLRYKKMQNEQNPFKKKSYSKIILPYYYKAAEISSPSLDITELKKRIKELEET